MNEKGGKKGKSRQKVKDEQECKQPVCSRKKNNVDNEKRGIGSVVRNDES